jgi:hypothetical protein
LSPIGRNIFFNEVTMCRSIKQLRRPDISVSEQEMQEAALQYVRKISGYRKPSRANTAAFEAAVAEIAESTRRLLTLIGKQEIQGIKSIEI